MLKYLYNFIFNLSSRLWIWACNFVIQFVQMRNVEEINATSEYIHTHRTYVSSIEVVNLFLTTNGYLLVITSLKINYFANFLKICAYAHCNAYSIWLKYKMKCRWNIVWTFVWYLVARVGRVSISDHFAIILLKIIYLVCTIKW